MCDDLEIFEFLESDASQNNEEKVKRRRLRDLSDPFDIEDSQFIKCYRLTKQMVHNLCGELRPHVSGTITKVSDITLERKVLIALSFYATGSYQRPVGNISAHSVAQPTVSVIIKQITRLLNLPQLQAKYIKFPRSQEERTNNRISVEYPEVELVAASSSLRLSDKDSQLCLSTARCCQSARGAGSSPASARREPPVYTSPGRCEARQAKLASRVRLKRTEDEDQTSGDETWCADAVERLARDVCAHAQFREELAQAGNEGGVVCRLAAQNASLRAALARAEYSQARLQKWKALQESACVCVCSALSSADRALECYDVLLALSEAKEEKDRLEAERVASQLLASLEAAPRPAPDEPLLPPGPWQHALGAAGAAGAAGGWCPQRLARLRRHAARLKAASVALRRAAPAPAPQLYAAHDADDDDETSIAHRLAVEMEEAVELEALLLAKESAANARLVAAANADYKKHSDPHRSKSRRRNEKPQFEKHWLHSANETQL